MTAIHAPLPRTLLMLPLTVAAVVTGAMELLVRRGELLARTARLARG